MVMLIKYKLSIYRIEYLLRMKKPVYTTKLEKE